MNRPTHRDALAAHALAPSQVPQDRFAPDERRPQREQPLMRRIEAASLLPDLSIHFATHTVPRSGIFDTLSGGFARGTLLATRDGPVAVEDLMPGDFVESSEGLQPVMWIGSTHLHPQLYGETQSEEGLIRVMTESFGVARPVNDVLFGPCAGLLHNPPQLRQANGQGHVVTPLRDFVDGLNVFRVAPPSAVKVYHIALRRHAAVQVSGLQFETYHPGPGRVEKLGYNGQRLFLSIFPHIAEPKDFGPLAYPRVDKELLDGVSAA